MRLRLASSAIGWSNSFIRQMRFSLWKRFAISIRNLRNCLKIASVSSACRERGRKTESFLKIRRWFAALAVHRNAWPKGPLAEELRKLVGSCQPFDLLTTQLMIRTGNSELKREVRRDEEPYSSHKSIRRTFQFSSQFVDCKRDSTETTEQSDCHRSSRRT